MFRDRSSHFDAPRCHDLKVGKAGDHTETSTHLELSLFLLFCQIFAGFVCETGGMLDGQLRGVGVRGCLGGFLIFVGQAFFYAMGFLRLRVAGSSSGNWDVESVSWTGYSIGFCRLATV